jgi:hypothetical protein
MWFEARGKGEHKTTYRSFLVDKEQFDAWVGKYTWRFDKDGYCFRNSRKNGKAKMYYLHRELMDRLGRLVPNCQVDHINNDRTDNRLANLRICSRGQNNKNRTSSKKYKGVYPQKDGSFKVYVNCDNEPVYIGRFYNEKMAAHYYNRAAKQLHGEFAKLNVLD